MNYPATFSRALFVVATLISTPALAATVSFQGFDNPRGTLTNSKQAETNFLATLSAYGTDTLEGSTRTFKANPGLIFTGSSLTATTNSTYIATAFGAYSISPTNFLADRGPANPELPGIPDVFTFNEPITAFGFYASNVGDGSVANSISLLLVNTKAGTSTPVEIGTFGPLTADNSVLYFGVTSTDAFDQVQLVESYDYDGLLLDNITAGYVVPEPSSVVLAGSAAVLVFAASWRRRSAA